MIKTILNIEGVDGCYIDLMQDGENGSSSIILHLCDCNGIHISGYNLLSFYYMGVVRQSGIDFTNNQLDMDNRFQLKIIGVDEL